MRLVWLFLRRHLSRWCTWLVEVIWVTWWVRWVHLRCDWQYFYRLNSRVLSFCWWWWWRVFWVRICSCQLDSNRGKLLVDFWFYLRSLLLRVLRYTFLLGCWWRRDGIIWNVDFVVLFLVGWYFLYWDEWSRLLWDGSVFLWRLRFSGWGRHRFCIIWIGCRRWRWFLRFRSLGWVLSFLWLRRRGCWNSLQRWGVGWDRLFSSSLFKGSEIKINRMILLL